MDCQWLTNSKPCSVPAMKKGPDYRWLCWWHIHAAQKNAGYAHFIELRKTMRENAPKRKSENPQLWVDDNLVWQAVTGELSKELYGKAVLAIRDELRDNESAEDMAGFAEFYRQNRWGQERSIGKIIRENTPAEVLERAKQLKKEKKADVPGTSAKSEQE